MRNDCYPSVRDVEDVKSGWGAVISAQRGVEAGQPELYSKGSKFQDLRDDSRAAVKAQCRTFGWY